MPDAGGASGRMGVVTQKNLELQAILWSRVLLITAAPGISERRPVVAGGLMDEVSAASRGAAGDQVAPPTGLEPVTC